MEALIAERRGAARHRELADDLGLAAEQVRQAAEVEGGLEACAPVGHEFGDQGEKRIRLIDVTGKAAAFGAIERSVDEARFDGRRTKINEFATRGVGEKQVVEQLRLVGGCERVLGFEFVDGTTGHDEICEILVNETAKGDRDRKLALHRAEAVGGEAGGEVDLVDGFVAESAEVALSGEGMRHHSMIELSELFGGEWWQSKG